MVENVMKILDKKKLLDDTYVIYASDNGYHLGMHLFSFRILITKVEVLNLSIHEICFI